MTRRSSQRVAAKNGHPACRVEPWQLCVWLGVQLGRWGPACRRQQPAPSPVRRRSFPFPACSSSGPGWRGRWDSTEVPCSEGQHLSLHRLGVCLPPPGLGSHERGSEWTEGMPCRSQKEKQSRPREASKSESWLPQVQTGRRLAGYLDFLNSRFSAPNMISGGIGLVAA